MPLSTKDYEHLKELQSGHISDAMEGMALPRTVLHGYTYLGPTGTRMAGTAFTVQQIPKHASANHADALVTHAQVSRELASEGEIILIDAAGRTDTGTWGENHCNRAKPRGVSGVVINGATRDADEIKLLNFPVFCKGFSPIKSQWDLETLSHNQPINLDGVQIRPGDIIFGDTTGILVIPPEMKDPIISTALKIRDTEARWTNKSEI